MSTVYLSERAASDLEKMMPLSWHFSEDGDSEMWTALACLLYSNNSLSTAAYFAQRVNILICHLNIFGFIHYTNTLYLRHVY